MAINLRQIIQEELMRLSEEIDLSLFPPGSQLSKDKKGVITPFINKKYELRMYFKFRPNTDGSYNLQEYESWGGGLNEKGSERSFPNLPKAVHYAKYRFKSEITRKKENEERSQQFKFRYK